MSDTLSSPSMDASGDIRHRTRSGLFSGRRGRYLREYLTAYLMIGPAVVLILVFGIFPVAFALYVSLHRWRLVRSDFLGLENYLDAVDSLVYTVLFGLGVGALWLAFRFIRRVYEKATESEERPWLLIIPAAIHAVAILAFFRWAFVQLPELLDIADIIRRQERTRELFIRLLREAFQAESVLPAWRLFAGLFLASIIAALVFYWIFRYRDNFFYQASLAGAWLATAVGFGLLRTTFTEIQLAYVEAVESGTDPGIWPQLIMISSGVILLLIGWKIWNSIGQTTSNRSFFWRIFAAGALLVGGVLLIIEIPSIVATGDPDLWQGLKVTIFYSAGTVPIQLAVALFLAILLYQKLAGSSAFRIIFFLPYVTPVVASAAVFKQIFSNRVQSPANELLRLTGAEPQLWLREPAGIFDLIAGNLGIDLPAWAAGPSLALIVIMILSIWMFVGYNTVIYLAGLVNIPGELIEAAEIDGAGKWEVFRNITFPLLSPTTYFLSLIAIIGTFKAFNTIWVLREGEALGTADPFSVVIFAEFFEKTRYGYASALAFVLFAVIISLTIINNRVQGSRVFYG